MLAHAKIHIILCLTPFLHSELVHEPLLLLFGMNGLDGALLGLQHFKLIDAFLHDFLMFCAGFIFRRYLGCKRLRSLLLLEPKLGLVCR